eukprot:sb/3467622/
MNQLYIQFSHPSLYPSIIISLTGVYENGNSKVFTEADDPIPSGKSTYFTKLCKKWEETSQLPSEIPTRLVNARFGVVLAHDTEPMSMLLPATLHTAPTIMGHGTQPFPWIHVHDAVSAVIAMMEQTEMSGPVNVVAPNVNTNTDLAHALGKACICGDTTLPLHAGLFRLMYGTERADNILLDSPRVAPGKLVDSGFEFAHPELEGAIEALVQEKTNMEGVESLYKKFGVLADAKDKAGEFEEEYLAILSTIKNGSGAEKRLCASFVPRFFKSFPNHQDAAFNAQLGNDKL